MAAMRARRLHRCNTAPGEEGEAAQQSWAFVPPQTLPRTDAIQATLCDMRLPLTFALADCDLIADHIGDTILALQREDAT